MYKDMQIGLKESELKVVEEIESDPFVRVLLEF